MSEYERAQSQADSTSTDGAANAVAREIGQNLARGREAQGLSVDDVSARLKVPAQKVMAVESGSVEALPDLTFAKGLMRAYARMLHIDIDALLARFHAQAGSPAPEVAIRRQGSLNESFDDRRRFRSASGASSGSGGRWVWLALMAAVVSAGALFGVDHVKQWMDARQHEAGTTDVAAPTVPQAESEAGTVTAVLPQVMAGADGAAPGEARAAGAAASSPLVTPLSSAEGAAAASAPEAPVVAEPAAAPATATATAATGELKLRFSAETWYEVRDRDGKIIMGGTGKAGEEVSGAGAAPYKVVIGNVKGVQAMTRDGQPVDLQAANRNNVARLTLP